MDPKIIGQHIKKYRKERGMTQQQLAEALFVSDKTISRWELGNGFPDIEELPRLAKLLGITIDQLVGKENVQDDKQEVVAEKTPTDKKKVFQRIVACVLCAAVVVSTVCAVVFLSGFYAEATYVFEAENAIFSDAFRIEQTPRASGGAVAAWMHAADSSLEFVFSSKRSVSAKLSIKLNRAWSFRFEDKFSLIVNKEPVNVGIVSGVGWDGTEEGRYYSFGEPVEVDIHVVDGVNTIELVVVDGLNMTVDCIGITAPTRLTDKRNRYVFEAEKAAIDCKYSVMDSSKASGNKYVSEWKSIDVKSGTMTYVVNSDKSAWLTMYVYFNHPNTVVFENKFLLSVNGESVTVGKIVGVGNESGKNNEVKFAPPAEVTIHLQKGDNEIVFTVVENGENFDCIVFDTALALRFANAK